MPSHTNTPFRGCNRFGRKNGTNFLRGMDPSTIPMRSYYRSREARPHVHLGNSAKLLPQRKMLGRRLDNKMEDEKLCRQHTKEADADIVFSGPVQKKKRQRQKYNNH